MSDSNHTNTIGDFSGLLQAAKTVIAPTYARPDTLFVDGHGAFLRDARGDEYLDMTSGIAVLPFGHRSAIVAEAIAQAAQGLIHVSNLYHSAPSIQLAKRLVEHSFADSVFFANSGAEAVEAAIKFARLSGGEDRRNIVTCSGSFHGRTLGALAATDRPDYQRPFEPLPRGFRKAPWNDNRALDAIDDRTAAVILEPIQGEQGVRVADTEWIRAIRRRCDDVGALLIFDEIQCGLGRTGSLWAHEKHSVSPDMMTLAKPLGGGLPIGAVLMTEQVANHLRPGVHGTTFGGGPFVTSVALRVFDTIRRSAFLGDVQKRGAYLREKLTEVESLSAVAEIRGEGLIIGIRLVENTTAQVVNAAYREKLLIVPSAEQVVRILPPLTVSFEEIDLCVDRLKRTLERVQQAEKQ